MQYYTNLKSLAFNFIFNLLNCYIYARAHSATPCLSALKILVAVHGPALKIFKNKENK